MESNKTSQSTRATWLGKMTHPTSKATPSSFASASPSSSSNPGRSPVLLEKGSAVGLAQISSLPRALIESSGRAKATDATATTNVNTTTTPTERPNWYLRIVTD